MPTAFPNDANRQALQDGGLGKPNAPPKAKFPHGRQRDAASARPVISRFPPHLKETVEPGAAALKGLAEPDGRSPGTHRQAG